jgi:hypothetical protein
MLGLLLGVACGAITSISGGSWYIDMSNRGVEWRLFLSLHVLEAGTPNAASGISCDFAVGRAFGSWGYLSTIPAEVTVTNVGLENVVIDLCIEGDPGVGAAWFHTTSTAIDVAPESEELYPFGILFAGGEQVRSPTSMWVGPHDNRTSNLKSSQSSVGPGHGRVAWSYQSVAMAAGISTVCRFYVGEIGGQTNSSLSSVGGRRPLGVSVDASWGSARSGTVMGTAKLHYTASDGNLTHMFCYWPVNAQAYTAGTETIASGVTIRPWTGSLYHGSLPVRFQVLNEGDATVTVDVAV